MPWPCIICNGNSRTQQNSGTPLKIQRNKNKFVLHNFCRYFRIKLPLPSLEWDLTREEVPFCPTCFLQAERLVKLNRKLEMLKAELGQIQGWVKSQITNISSSSRKNQLKGWSCEDPRVQTIRDIIVGPCIRLRRASLTEVNIEAEVAAEPVLIGFEDDHDDSVEIKSEGSSLEDFSEFGKEKAEDIETIESKAEEMEREGSDDDSMDFEDNNSDDSDFEPHGEEDSLNDLEPEDKEFEFKRSRKKMAPDDPSRSKAPRAEYKTTVLGEDKYRYGDELEYTGNDSKGYKCCQCTDGHVYPKRRHIRTHLRNHMRSPGGYKCHVCGKDVSSSYALRVHIETHNDNNVAVCEFCGKGCKGAVGLRFHTSQCHSSDLNVCEVCGKAFSHKNYLAIHRKAVHLKIKRYCCELCGKGFFTLGGLRKHMGTNAHSSEKPFSCDDCGQRFNTPQHRTRHIRQFHNPPAGDQDSEDEAAGDPNLRCKYCGLQYNRQNNLTRHLLQIHHINVKGVAWKTKAPRKILEKVTPSTDV